MLVALSHPAIASGVFELLRTDPLLEVARVAPGLALERARQWRPDLILADAPVARELREVAGQVIVMAAGDGAAASGAAAEIGAAGWAYVDHADRRVAAFFAPGGGSRTRDRVALPLALVSIASLTAALGLVWRALAP